MTEADASVIYYLKTNGKGSVVDHTRTQVLSPRVIVLKGIQGQRLACIVESKKGYVVDICKKNHQ